MFCCCLSLCWCLCMGWWCWCWYNIYLIEVVDGAHDGTDGAEGAGALNKIMMMAIKCL